MKCRILLPAFLLGCSLASAQDRPIGNWRAHYSFTLANCIASDGNKLFVTGGPGFFTFDRLEKEYNTYSKVEGMADVNTRQVAYDALTGTTIIGYDNSNIDLFSNHSFYSLPDLKNKNFSGDKNINHIHTENGLAYLSTGLGIVVVNLERREVKATYTFTIGGQVIPITAFQSSGTFFYATTPRGLYRASKTNPNLQAFSSWTRIGNDLRLRGLAAVQNRLYTLGDSVLYRLNNAGNDLDTVYQSNSITHIDPGTDDLLVCEFYNSSGNGRVKHFSAANTMVDSFSCGYPRKALKLADGTEWVADQYQSLVQRTGNTVAIFQPSGPRSFTAFDIQASNREVLVAHGSHNDRYIPQSNPFGLSVLNNESWRNYSQYTAAPFSNTYDITCVTKDPRTGDVYAGSLQNGLYILKADGSTEVLRENSPIEQNDPQFANYYSVLSLTTDLDGNVVVGQMMAKDHEIALKTPEGNWVHYTTPYSSPSAGMARSAGGLIVDDNNQKWYFQPQGGGVFVYNDNHTPENLADDTGG